MDLQERTARVGLMAILCAAVFRLASTDLIHYSFLLAETFLSSIQTVQEETGHDVRFSPSLEGFSPDFVETPQPFLPEPKEPEIPYFSDSSLVDITYMSSVRPETESLLSQPLQWDLRGQEPTVLILHTHSTESYTKQLEPYEESAAYRTLDENYNMLAIGQLVAQLLTEQGIPAIQDREIHDYPSYNGSYVHARESISAYLTEYPSIQLILDLHRDASDGTGGQLRTLAHAEGERSAQLMVVVGTNHENYAQNLSLGLKLHAQLQTQSPGIVRPLQLRSQRFNQDLLPGTLLIEVGAAGNTHEEAARAARQLANAVTALARGTRQEEPEAQ